MSLSIEIRVNGHPVSVITAHNKTAGELSYYDGQGVVFQMDGNPVSFGLVDIKHHRNEGIIKLASILLTQAAKAVK